MPPPLSSQTRPEARRQFWLTLLVIELFVLAVHGNGLRIAHAEGDEVLFTFLALRLAESPGSYHIRGSLEGPSALAFHELTSVPLWGESFRGRPTAELLLYPPGPDGVRRPRYDPEIYDRPIFIHPPLYPYTLALFQRFFGPHRAVLLSAFGHALAIALLALLVRRWAGDGVALVSAGLLAVEAMSFICAERLWIESMLQATVTGAMLAAVWSAERGGVRRFAIAGACLGMAGLTKQPAGALLPAVAVTWMLAPNRPAVRDCAAYLLASALPVVLWMVITAVVSGELLIVGLPSQWSIENTPYIRQSLGRSPAYYVFGLLFASPVLLYALPGLLEVRRRRWVWTPLTWAGSMLFVMTLIALGGMGYQLRHLVPMIPALCVLACARRGPTTALASRAGPTAGRVHAARRYDRGDDEGGGRSAAAALLLPLLLGGVRLPVAQLVRMGVVEHRERRSGLLVER